MDSDKTRRREAIAGKERTGVAETKLGGRNGRLEPEPPHGRHQMVARMHGFGRIRGRFDVTELQPSGFHPKKRKARPSNDEVESSEKRKELIVLDASIEKGTEPSAVDRVHVVGQARRSRELGVRQRSEKLDTVARRRQRRNRGKRENRIPERAGTNSENVLSGIQTGLFSGHELVLLLIHVVIGTELDLVVQHRFELFHRGSIFAAQGARQLGVHP